MESLEVWNALASVPESAKKPIGGGRLKGMTDINPVWRLKTMTEHFGICGCGWWYEVTDKRIEYDEITNTKCAFVDIMLYFYDPDTGEQCHGIPGTGGASFVTHTKNGAEVSDECYKMALTDALSVAMKAIGMGADVYWANGRSKYSPGNTPSNHDKIICHDCGEEVQGYTTKDNRTVTAAEWAQNAAKRYGVTLCTACAKTRESAKEGT